MRTLFCLIAIFFSLQSNASKAPALGKFEADVIGNGGDAVVCPNTVEVLDRYEARVIREIDFDWRMANAGYHGILHKIVERIRRFDPRRAERYESDIKEFFQSTRFIEDGVLVDVPDSQHVIVPVGCTIEQVALQAKPVFPEDPRYLINKSIWDRMQVQDNALLIMHEVIYKEAIESGQTNSIRTRYFNSILASPIFSPGTAADYHRAVKYAGLMQIIDLTAVGENGALVQFDASSADPHKIPYAAAMRCQSVGMKMSSTRNCDDPGFKYPALGEFLASMKDFEPSFMALFTCERTPGIVGDRMVHFGATNYAITQEEGEFREANYVLCEPL